MCGTIKKIQENDELWSISFENFEFIENVSKPVREITPSMFYKQQNTNDLPTGWATIVVACDCCLASKKITSDVAYLLLKKSNVWVEIESCLQMPFFD